MDSRNYDQLITGSGAVWQALDVDGIGDGVGGCVMDTNILLIYLRTKLHCYSMCLLIYHNLFPFLHAVEKFIWWFVCSSAGVV